MKRKFYYFSPPRMPNKPQEKLRKFIETGKKTCSSYTNIEMSEIPEKTEIIVLNRITCDDTYGEVELQFGYCEESPNPYYEKNLKRYEKELEEYKKELVWWNTKKKKYYEKKKASKIDYELKEYNRLKKKFEDFHGKRKIEH